MQPLLTLFGIVTIGSVAAMASTLCWWATLTMYRAIRQGKDLS